MLIRLCVAPLSYLHLAQYAQTVPAQTGMGQAHVLGHQNSSRGQFPLRQGFQPECDECHGHDPDVAEAAGQTEGTLAPLTAGGVVALVDGRSSDVVQEDGL
ncbi:MAG: hypothetical protein ACR2IK_19045 [Chloroflexota bacterium]